MQADLFIPPVIGIAGPAGSGKDTVAGIVQKLIAHESVILKFAGPLKAMTAELLACLGIPASAIEDRARKEEVIPELGVSIRHLMVTLGTEWGRDLVNANIWTILMDQQIQRARARDVTVIISDVRFNNEADLIRSHGGAVWHLHRPGFAQSAAHRSEQGLDRFLGDVEILNDASFDHLRDRLEAALLGGTNEQK